MIQIRKAILDIFNELALSKNLTPELLEKIQAELRDSRIPEHRLEKFKKIIEILKRVLIVLTHVDPDSIACAKIMATVLKRLGKDASIYYAGVLDDPQNKYIWNTFHLVDEFKSIDDNLTQETINECDVILLDSSFTKDSRLGRLIINPRIIIDHHPTSDKIEEDDTAWYWIETCGSATTMIVKIFLDMGFDFEPKDELSTLAIIAFLTDADVRLLSPHLIALDHSIYYYLTRYADRELANKTFGAILDEKYADFYIKAYQDRYREGNIALTSLGVIPRDDVGYAARLAEAFCTLREIGTLFIWTIANDPLTGWTIFIKARSIDGKMDLDSFIKNRLGKNHETGAYYGRARHGKGGALIPLGFFAPTAGSQEHLLNMVRSLMKDIVFGTVIR